MLVLLLVLLLLLDVVKVVDVVECCRMLLNVVEILLDVVEYC